MEKAEHPTARPETSPCKKGGDTSTLESRGSVQDWGAGLGSLERAPGDVPGHFSDRPNHHHHVSSSLFPRGDGLAPVKPSMCTY